ncbi:MAG: hypothetical protein DHS20C13_31140 [Thermodesulfobacteriota bacterium]|nr:MAG: hypothetical protein DHS20C13_31140 [Thermodesulfobacteriota bacterium]
MANILKITRFIAALLLIITYTACEDDDVMEPTLPSYIDIDVVTGLDLYDFNGAPIGRWKFPNNKPGDNHIFPNPCTDAVFVLSQQNIQKLWLVPASCFSDSTTMNIPELSGNLSFSISDIEDNQIKSFEIMGATGNNIALDLSDVAPGFYRLFIQLEDEEIYWENIYTDNSVNSFPDWSILEEGCE